MDSKQYIFPPFCQIEKMDNPMAEEMLAKENVTSKCALFNSKAKSIFFINESIKNFLELFREPKSFQEFLEVVYADTNEMDEAKNKELFAFFELMIKQGFIVDANTDFDVEAPDIVVENFKIETVLKNSDIEKVCVAIDERENKKVVLKFLMFKDDTKLEDRQKATKRFDLEFSIMEEINGHSRICPLVSYDSGKSLAVLEYLDGLTIKHLLKERQLSLQEKLIIALQIVEAVSHLHANGITHGDIHANQFMVDSHLNVKMIDFGMSNHLDSIGNEAIRRGGVSYYLEPENIVPNAFVQVNKYTPNYYSEVYRIGTLVYYILFEKYPFESFSWKKLCEKIKTEDPEILTVAKDGSQIPETWVSFLKTALSKKPENRFESAIDVEAYLKKG